MVDSTALSSAFKSGALSARSARVESVKGSTLTLSDGTTLDVSGARAGLIGEWDGLRWVGTLDGGR